LIAYEEDTTKLYGDLNWLNTIESWLCLYYARDLRLGSPLTPSMLIKAVDDRTSTQKKTYLPVHDFSNNNLTANNTGYTPYNLNQFSQKSNASMVYMFLKRDLTVNPVAATLMGNSTFLIAIGAFIVGSGIIFAASFVTMKRKCKKQTLSILVAFLPARFFVRVFFLRTPSSKPPVAAVTLTATIAGYIQVV